MTLENPLHAFAKFMGIKPIAGPNEIMGSDICIPANFANQLSEKLNTPVGVIREVWAGQTKELPQDLIENLVKFEMSPEKVKTGYLEWRQKNIIEPKQRVIEEKKRKEEEIKERKKKEFLNRWGNDK